jgi:hypothetical protein
LTNALRQIPGGIKGALRDKREREREREEQIYQYYREKSHGVHGKNA